MNDNKLFKAFGSIDEEYIKEAEYKVKRSIGLSKIIGIAACFVIIIGLSLYLFLPFGSNLPDVSAYNDSEYFPLIEKMSASFYTPNQYKNNFEYLTSKISSIGNDLKGNWATDANSALLATNGSNNTTSDAAESGSNGSSVEITDNQVDGVIESDIIKRTEKYIFRLCRSYSKSTEEITLKVYSIEKEESKEISAYIINSGDSIKKSITDEMYLSDDGNTVTVILNYTENGKAQVDILSLDVSDVENISQKNIFTIDGSYNSSRITDGKLLLITEFYFNKSKVDYDDPETYVPKITTADGEKCIAFEDIIFPDKIGNTRYSVVSLLDAGTLDLIGASALLNFTDDIYVSDNSIYVTRKYTKTSEIAESIYTTEAMTDIAVLSFAGENLEQKGVITVIGTVKDKWSLDEKDDYLRVVASTNKNTYKEYSNGGNVSADISVDSWDEGENANLYIYSLPDNSLVASVIGFAPDGETAESVRFDGDTLYVCTAEVIKYTDPVYYFDLSDYTNITFTDTGTVDGYSTSLIDLGDGFLLGIGVETRQYSKVEVYEEGDGEVVSVDKYMFEGSYASDYKAYLIDRTNRLFGFPVSSLYDEDSKKYTNTYILLQFNGYELIEMASVEFEGTAERIRCVYIDGYLYMTGDTEFKVTKV